MLIPRFIPRLLRRKSKDIERWGSGIKRIHDECISAGVKVEFKRLKTGFVVVFYRLKWEDGEGLGENGKSKTGEETRGKIRIENAEQIAEEVRKKCGEGFKRHQGRFFYKNAQDYTSGKAVTTNGGERYCQVKGCRVFEAHWPD